MKMMESHGCFEPAKALIREPEFIHRLLESVPDGIVACDADGRLTLFNHAARKWFGDDLAGISLDEWSNHHDRYINDGSTPLPAEKIPLVRAFRGEKLAGEEVAIVTPDKQVRFFRVNGGPIRNAKGGKLGAMVVMYDITKLRRMAERTTELKETNRNLRAELKIKQREKEQAGRERALLRCILDSANDLIYTKDRDSVYQSCNLASEQFLGLSESDQIGMTDYDFFDPEAAALIRAADRQIMETGKPLRSEEWVAYADGHKILMETVKVPYRGPDGELLGLVGITRDITKYMRAEEALKKSEAKYMDLYENAPDMYVSVNAKTALIEECNLTLTNTLGYTKAEIIGRSVFGLYYPDCLEEAKEIFKLFVKTGKIHDKELQLQKKNGSKLDISLNVTSIRDEDGQILISRLTLRDITERKRNASINSARLRLMQFAVTNSSEELIEETLNEAEKLTDSRIGFCHFVEDDQKHLTLRNWSARTRAKLCKVKGKGQHYPIDEAGVWVDCVAAGKPVIHNDYASLSHRKGLPQGHAEIIRELVVPVFRGNKIRAILGVGNKPVDYTEKDVEAISLLADLAWEIAVHKRTKEELDKHREHLEELVKERTVESEMAKNEAQQYLDVAGVILVAVDAARKVTLINQKGCDVLQSTSAEIIGKDWFETFVPQNIRRDAIENFRQFMAGELEPVEYFESPVLTQKGEEKLVAWHNVPLKDSEETIIGSLSSGEDITEKKRAETQIMKLNQDLQHRAAALEAANKELEGFTYSVSHDLRAPLRHMDGFIELLKKKVGAALDKQGLHYMDTISNAAQKMGRLIDELLSFSHMGRHIISFKQVDLGSVVHDIMGELEPDIAGRTIAWRISNLPMIRGDETMLRSVLAALISNALKFTRPRQQACIEIGSKPGKNSETVIFVRDNGVGFDMAYADKLFGVFQRLHRAEEFEGTGIGLANVRRIIARHGGRTWAKGTPDQGATFFFSLPYI
jgi:PAS domain S-box-containing protein